VIVRGLPLRFVSVHLIPNPSTILAHTKELLQLAGDTTTLPLVFGGDFNTTADDPSNPSYVIYQTLINAGLTDAWNPRRPGPTCCQDPNLLNARSKLEHRIDLILLRGAFARSPPLCISALAGDPCGGVGCPPTESARQFSVSRMPNGSAAALEIAVAPIKLALLALCSVP
jgi:endonuclease/exonuclease/phosphatase family metal-dependent hydrolase